MKASIYNYCTVFFSLPFFILLLVKFRSVVTSCFKCVVCSDKDADITSIFSHNTLNIVLYAQHVLNNREQQSRSKALILSFIELILIELFQKLELSYMRCFSRICK